MSKSLYNKFFINFLKESNSVSKKLYRKAIFTINTPLYATIAFIKTKTYDLANKVHKLIIYEALSVLYYDLYQETGENEFKYKSNKFHNLLLKKLNKKNAKELLKLEEKIKIFWDIENKIHKKILFNKKITDKEIEIFTLRKSKDVFAYFKIMSFFANVPVSIRTVLYIQQIKRDLEDDFNDLLEDSKQNMPNPLLLRLYKNNLYNPNKNYTKKELIKLIIKNGIFKKHKDFIENYCKKYKYNLKDEYKWIEKCCKYYDNKAY